MTCLSSSRLKVIFLAITATACAAAGSAFAVESTPTATLDGTVTLSGGVLAAGVGYKWGHGTLTYRGQEFKFCIRGPSIGDIGVAKLNANGVVFDLKSLEDFSGTYTTLSLGAAVARGESAAILKNKRGVEIELESQVVGVRFNIAAAGLKIALAGERGCRVRT